MSIRKSGPGAEVVPIRPLAKMYITIWDLPELTWARSAVGIDVRPGSISRGDYADIGKGLKAVGLIGARIPDHEIAVVRSTSDTEIFDVTVRGVASYRVAPSGSGFSRIPV